MWLSRFSHVRLFVTLWVVTHQASLSMGFSRQNYWSRLPCPPLEDLPDPGIKLCNLHLTCIGRWVLSTSATWEVPNTRLLLLLLLSHFSRAIPQTAAHQAPPSLGFSRQEHWWVAISFPNAWKWKVKVKSLSHVWLSATSWTAAYQAPLSMGFSR